LINQFSINFKLRKKLTKGRRIPNKPRENFGIPLISNLASPFEGTDDIRLDMPGSKSLKKGRQMLLRHFHLVNFCGQAIVLLAFSAQYVVGPHIILLLTVIIVQETKKD
jgi:hypothetical protein